MKYEDLPFYQGLARKCVECGRFFKQGEVVIVISNTEVLCYGSALDLCFTHFLFRVGLLDSPKTFMRFKGPESIQDLTIEKSQKLVEGLNTAISSREVFEKMMNKLWGDKGGGE